jgi:hypothetical protein
LLDPQRFVERRHVGAVDRLGDREQLGMAAHPQTRVGELQRPQDLLYDPLGRTGRSGRLEHLHLMAAARARRAAERIGERLDPHDLRAASVGAERRPAVPIERRVAGNRRALQQIDHVALNVVEFALCDHPFEHVEPTARIGIENRRIEPTGFVESNRPAVAECERAPRAVLAIANHRRLFGAIVDRRRIDQR